jgi:hypothetical protein
MKNVHSNFHKILWNFLFMFVHPYNDFIPIYKKIGEVLGIIITILYQGD